MDAVEEGSIDIEGQGSRRDLEEENEEQYNLDGEGGGWSSKKIFLLPFEPVWSYTLLFLAVFQTCLVIHDIGFQGDGEHTITHIKLKYVSYTCDVLYLIDILLTIGFKNLEGLQTSSTQIDRPNWVLLMDFISILPTELFVPKDSFKLKHYIQMNKLLKILRIYHNIYFNHNLIGSSKTHLQVFEYCFSMTLAIVFGCSITHEIVCVYVNCSEEISKNDYIEYFYIALSKLTTRGIMDYPEHLLWMFCFSILGLVVFICVISVSLGYYVIAISTLFYHRHKFLHKVKLLQGDLKKNNIPADISNRCMEFFDNFWKKRTGYDDSLEYFFALPQAMYEEVTLDISWAAWKHSKLFRDSDVFFLRHISIFVKSRFMLPGRIMYDKDSTKNMLMFLVSGVVQVLSEEDDETPILSFSGGTCLGESSLFLNCKSKSILRCKTFCNIHILEKKDFMRVIKLFPKDFRQMLVDFNARLKKVKDYQKLAKLINVNQNMEQNTDHLTVMWLKSTLHRLMVKDGDTSTKHQCQNVFLRREFGEDKFINKCFTAEYLDVLAISETLELTTDSVFLKTSCPCIFQPDSIILDMWETIIAPLAIVTAIIIPYFAFVEPSRPIWFEAFLIIIAIFWFLDLYVQISTAVKTSDEIIASVQRIFLYRMSTSEFLIDVFAAFPLNFLSSIIIRTVTPQVFTLLELNKIIKISRIQILFQKWENKTDANILLIRYLKHFCVFCYTIFFFSCAMYAVNCFNYVCTDELINNSSAAQLLWCTFTVTQILSGVGLPSPLSSNPTYYPFHLVTTVISNVFYVFVYGRLAAEHTLARMKRIKMQEMVVDLHGLILSTGVHDKYHHRIFSYVETQWLDNEAAVLLQNRAAFAGLMGPVEKTSKEAAYRETLLSVPFFEGLPDTVILDICLIARNVIFPPHEVVCYAKEICENFYIVQKGYCKVISNVTGLKRCVLGPMENISVTEACLGVPVLNTVVTTTHCTLISINAVKLKSIYLKYPELSEVFKNAAEDPEIQNQLSRIVEATRFHAKYTVRSEREEIDSFQKFGYNIRMDTIEEYDYYNPFDRLGYLSFVQYFLLRYTLHPYGKFFLGWEIVRCFCAVLSALFFPIVEISTCTDCEWFFLLIMLDGMAWLDIYLRFHVCYYNDNGILVTHPLKTAVYYLKHGFLIDFLAVFPVHVFIAVNERLNNSTLAIMQLNRMLQMHRYVGFFNCIDNHTLLPSTVIPIVKYFPILLILSSCTGSGMLNWICVFQKDMKNPPGSVFADGVSCLNDTWITNSKFQKPLDVTRVLFYGIYFSTSILTSSGMTGFLVEQNFNAVFVIALSILAYLLSALILSKAISQFTSGDSTLIEYQDTMKSVRGYMSHYKVSLDLQHQLIAHYELKWRRKRGLDLHLTISNFNRSFQQDVLYDVYGKVLQETSVFISDSKSFLHSLLLEVSHDVIIKSSFITCLNDISKYLYIIYKGRANVIGPDGSKLATLTPGSMFGNLDECEMSRQTVSVIALGHVEIFTIESLRYYGILRNYPLLHKRYRNLTALHVDYLEGRGHVAAEDEVSFSRRDSTASHASSAKSPLSLIRNKVFNPESIYIKIWQSIILFVVCNLEVCFGLYQIALAEFAMPCIIFQYLCDVLYIINYFVKTHTAYENDVGVLIQDLDQIKHQFAATRFSFWVAIISMIPLDIFAWFFPWSTFRIMYPILRLNRLLRFIYVVYYFRDQTKKLAINLYAMRFTFILFWCTSILHLCTCMLIAVSSLGYPNMHPTIISDLSLDTTFDKLKIYATYLYLVVSLFIRSSQHAIYPESWYLIMYCICLMISLQLISATFMAQIYSTLQLGYHRQNMYAQHLVKVQTFMQREQVSPSLLMRTYEYLKLLWRYHRGSDFPRLLAEAPTILRESILNSAFAYHINSHFVFEKCHVDFNRQIVACLRNRTYFRDDYIVLKGTLNSCMYFIHEGNVVVLDEDELHKETVVGVLKAGMCFGVTQGLFPEKPHSYTFRSTKTTVILILDLITWQHLLQFYPASKVMIRERYSQYNDNYA